MHRTSQSSTLGIDRLGTSRGLDRAYQLTDLFMD
jgi:hypothetical protein